METLTKCKKINVKYRNIKGSKRQGRQQKVNHARPSPAPAYVKINDLKSKSVKCQNKSLNVKS